MSHPGPLEPQCSVCNKLFSTKYALAKHLRCVHRCDESMEEVPTEEFRCTAEICPFSSVYAFEQRKHVQRCPLIEVDRQFRAKWANKEDQYKHELTRLQTENNLLRTELTKAQQALERLTEQAIHRPTTTTTVTNQQNNLVKITNSLADYKAYAMQTHPHRVKDMLEQHFENYFFHGQQGLARFVVDHIIRMDDGKMIICCTDTSRKRFRFVNADGKLAEDMKAKLLTKKLSVPVREMCDAVFDRIIERLKTEKKVMISNGAGAFDLDFLDKKVECAEKRFIEIRSFDGDDNTDFLNELATLLRNPSLDVNEENADEI